MCFVNRGGRRSVKTYTDFCFLHFQFLCWSLVLWPWTEHILRAKARNVQLVLSLTLFAPPPPPPPFFYIHTSHCALQNFTSVHFHCFRPRHLQNNQTCNDVCMPLALSDCKFITVSVSLTGKWNQYIFLVRTNQKSQLIKLKALLLFKICYVVCAWQQKSPSMHDRSCLH